MWSGTGVCVEFQSGFPLGASKAQIGTDGDGTRDADEGNVISDHTSAYTCGVSISGPGHDTVVAGNLIGTDVSGTVSIRNYIGIEINTENNRIGTDGLGYHNELERNVVDAIWINGNAAKSNVVAGNHVGVDVTGTKRLGFGGMIYIANGANNNRIGTNADGFSDDLERNVIANKDDINDHNHALAIENATGNVVAGNFIGVGADGKTRVGGLSYGSILLRMNAVANTIGGTIEAERNVIAGNAWHGIWIGGGAHENLIPGNYVGLDAFGNSQGNGLDGICVSDGAARNLIGDAEEGARNVIAANARDGIAIVNGASENVIQANYIGTDVTGTVVLGNGRFGVSMSNGAVNNVVGTDGDGLEDKREGNRIVGNTTGVSLVDAGTHANSIRGNLIYANRGLGIDLGGDGVTPNDLGDADAGPNNLQNFPVIERADSGPVTRIAGSFNGIPGTAVIVDFYANSQADPSGYGEGKRWLGSTEVTANAEGNASFNVTLGAPTLAGEVITATATAGVSTSEFSGANVVAHPAVVIDVMPGSDLNPSNLASTGVIPVAILTTDTFDAASVNAASVVFAEAHAVHSAMEDVDGDGDLDLILHFNIQETNLADIYAQLLCDDLNGDGVLDSNHQTAAVSLTGQTATDEFFEGFDDVDLFLAGKNLRDLLDELAATGVI